ncbi:MAG TPA: c-type cytochrome [Pseudomonadales bacterium]|nr:c-type cytochrome [Pseudomonadales bacterium]
MTILAFSFFSLFSVLALAAQDRSGKEVVEAVCSACHSTGLNGAPRIGDTSAWSARAALGLSSLTQHAVNGIRNMPAHGGQPELSDMEIARAVTYMVNQSGGHWVAPINPNIVGTPRTGKEIVAGQCSKCHEKGLGGAPRIGVIQDWAPRVKLGIPYLVSSAIHGHGGMPPRGGQANLTDSELSTAILYMINPASANAPKTVAEQQRPGADMNPNHKIVGGVEVYMGYTTAENIRALPQGSPELSMHGGVPQGANYYHVNASVFDAATGAPISGATVSLDLDWPGQATTVVDLQPMFMGAGGSYGNYVKTQPNVDCPMVLHIKTAGGMVDVKFDHTFAQ